MRHLIIIISLIALTGCAGVKPWTKAEKAMLITSCLAAGADAYTTIKGLNNGCSEANPLMGENPSNAVVIGFTGIIQAAFIVAAHYWFPDQRLWILGGKTIASGGAALWNSTQY